MATVKQYNLAGLNANVELGKQGSYIAGTANAVNFYTATDELQKLSIANAVASNQAVTLAQLNAEAQDLVQHITVDVSHTSGTENIATIPAGSRILSVTVEINEQWSAANNTGTFIEVGDTDSGSRFIRSQDVDVLRVDQYHSQYQYKYLTEGTLTYSVTQGGATGGNAIVSVVLATDYALDTDTSAPAPTFAVAAESNTMNEGANITFTVTTTDFGSGTLYWATGGTASNADFVANSGTVSVTSNSGSFVISTAADVTTEGSETFFVQLRTDSDSGNIVATSSNVTIVDTSTTPPAEIEVNYLVVAGGGGGGGVARIQIPGAGGGAGGMRTGSHPIVIGSYTVTIGAGGGGGSTATSGQRGDSGVNSAFDTITADGGGGGGCRSAPTFRDGHNGGSGGGASWDGTPGTGIIGQGSNGGSGSTSLPHYGSGGGGGAGAVGANGTSTSGGDGGAGAASSISGSNLFYAGGGGGAGYAGGGNLEAKGLGGSGGGGDGSTGPGAGASGTANRGGGGGGGGSSPAAGDAGSGAGGAGGSGVVIIAYTTGTITATGGDITTSGGNTIHTFTSSGTFTRTA